MPWTEVGRFVYASTYVTNLFVEGKEGGVGLLTTAGFRDVLEIGRASRKPDVYDIHWRPARPLVPRHLRHGVIERIDHRGDVADAARRGVRARRAARAGGRRRAQHRGVPAARVRQSRRTSGASRELAEGSLSRRSTFRCRPTSCASSASSSGRARPASTRSSAAPIARHLAGLGDRLARARHRRRPPTSCRATAACRRSTRRRNRRPPSRTRA